MGFVITNRAWLISHSVPFLLSDLSNPTYGVTFNSASYAQIYLFIPSFFFKFSSITIYLFQVFIITSGFILPPRTPTQGVILIPWSLDNLHVIAFAIAVNQTTWAVKQ